MEQTRIIFGIGLVKQLAERLVYVSPTLEFQQSLIRLNAPIFTDAQEDDAVNRHLDSEVEIARGEPWIAKREVPSQHFAPPLYFGEKDSIDLGGPFLRLGRLSVCIEKALEDCFTGEHGGNLVPPLGVVGIGEVEDACCRGLVRLIGFDAAVVDCELLEVGENAERKLRRPGIAAQLEGRVHILLN